MKLESRITVRGTIAVGVVLALALSMALALWSGRVTKPPRALGLSDFYAKYVEVGGLPIASSARVPDSALLAARDVIRHMLKRRPDILHELVRNRIRVTVMAQSEQTTDIPEYSSLEPKEYWNQRARGLGATVERRVCSCAEENLLGYRDDRYRGENILVHEFGHTLHTMGLTYLDTGFNARLDSLYWSAKKQGLFAHTYAATNPQEYWAEGVQSWFDANRVADPPDGIHSKIDTRAKLVSYDPGLASLLLSVFRDTETLPPQRLQP